MATRIRFGIAGVVTACAALPMAAHAAGFPQLQYVQTLTASGHPRSYFPRGAAVEVRARVHALGVKAAAVHVTWEITSGKHFTFVRFMDQRLTGPVRGNLFIETERLSLKGMKPGAYRVTARAVVAGHDLTTSSEFWIT